MHIHAWPARARLSMFWGSHAPKLHLLLEVGHRAARRLEYCHCGLLVGAIVRQRPRLRGEQLEALSKAVVLGAVRKAGSAHLQAHRSCRFGGDLGARARAWTLDAAVDTAV